MSAYTKVTTQLRDQDSIVHALRQMGYDPFVAQTVTDLFELRGYRSMHETPRVQVAVKQEDLNKKLGRYVQDIGFEKKEDGFLFHVNDMDEKLLGPSTDFWEEFKLNYNTHQAEKKAQSVGLRVVGKKETRVDGRRHVQLVCR